LDEGTAEQLGRDDRQVGKANNPFANPALRAEYTAIAVGTKTHLLHAYNRGWHEESQRIAEQRLIEQGFSPRASNDASAKHIR
jgi:hypothetical protein